GGHRRLHRRVSRGPAPTVLIEREEPLQALATVLLRAAAGQGGLVSVGGEAGIGKSSLLREFGLRAGSRYPMHWGGCEALFTPRPLGPLQDMAHELHPRVVEHLRDGAAGAAVSGRAPELR